MISVNMKSYLFPVRKNKILYTFLIELIRNMITL
jgi:hypothetical protein